MNSPLVDNLEKVGAVLLGRSNSPTFALRWFTSNQVHGKTFNSRDRSRTPGGRCERFRPWACRGLTVTTDLVNRVPVGVRIVAAHFREDLCLQAGLAIEERSAPVSKSIVSPKH
ncbi:Asp-tRNA(Asn)/Glu-tRNA(Gln) amidotransferase A subunit family amidase [Paraburkholderia youngii]